MIREDKDALICDLAETYNIYDFEQLPLDKAAVFACGLKNDSRIKLKMSGDNVLMDTILLTAIVDRLSCLVWFKTKDAAKGINRPQFITELLNQRGKSKEVGKNMSFSSGKEFEQTRKRILKVVIASGD